MQAPSKSYEHRPGIPMESRDDSDPDFVQIECEIENWGRVSGQLDIEEWPHVCESRMSAPSSDKRSSAMLGGALPRRASSTFCSRGLTSAYSGLTVDQLSACIANFMPECRRTGEASKPRRAQAILETGIVCPTDGHRRSLGSRASALLMER